MQVSAQQENNQRNNLSGKRLNEQFDQCYFITENEIETLNKYVCANLVCYGSNYRYWYEQYSYLSKLYSVIRWRKKNNLAPAARKGEMVCKDQVINFF